MAKGILTHGGDILAKRITIVCGVAVTLSLVLAGCAPEADTGGDEASVAPSAAPSEVAETPEAEPVTQEEACDWDSPRLASGSASDVPSSSGADLASVLIGSWQNTHIDTGSGYEALKPTRDIRYVFQSTTRMLYCQDVQGATSHAENAVDFVLDGTEIVLPSPATGYQVLAWNDDTMVWKNHRDGSLYLLKRR